MKKLLLLVPLAILIVGCGGKADYFPLTVGNVWNYTTIKTTTMTTPDTSWSDTTTMKTEITQETTLDNETSVFEYVTTIDTYVGTTYIQETDEYILEYENKADTEPDTSLALPIEEGKTWTVRKDSAYTFTAVVLGKESVTVPAGTYDDCWKIGYITDNDTVFSYLAPDIGMVKNYYKHEDSLSTVEQTTELENATIK
ncbi:hypothetical protein BXT86_02895 [candidate division WOR-3 bacterium 4484_100]|uniref:DUF3108 domain-containing protein n=1 Tax=candidate division WOR-3 bacterium 4484_100 TaxID=1936077 RepID=A0A1V4QGH7_UNCW3|nr:MAG: hypothetical protein BXT86_02895 [candidate division WOR-3 bacterium 4484_100]